MHGVNQNCSGIIRGGGGGGGDGSFSQGSRNKQTTSHYDKQEKKKHSTTTGTQTNLSGPLIFSIAVCVTLGRFPYKENEKSQPRKKNPKEALNHSGFISI